MSLILDTKEAFSKQALFMEAWTRHYGNMIEWLPASVHGGINTVQADTMQISTELETFKADVINAVPAQHAGHIAQLAGVTNEQGWCNINPVTMQSVKDKHVYVLGDACVAAAMPKSAFAANSQAKVVAQAIQVELLGVKAVTPQYANICWSLLSANDGVKIGASYKAGKDKIESFNSFISKVGEPAKVREQTYKESVAWYQHITNDMFN